jgi:hypothetical protein
MGIAPLLRFLAGLRKGGRLTINSGTAAASLSMDGGHLVGAAFGAESGETAFDAVALTMHTGQFSFAEEVVDDDKRNLALDSAGVQRRLHELTEHRNRLAAVIPSPGWVLVPTSHPSSSEELVHLDRGEVMLLLRCDGRRTVIELAHGHGLLPTLTRAAHLVELGVAECKPPELTAPSVVGPAKDRTALEDTANRPRESVWRRAPRVQQEGGWARWRRGNTPPPETGG